MTKNYDKYFETHPDICGGQTVIKGTRIRLKVVLDNLAEGHTPEEIAAEYQSLSLASIQAVVEAARRFLQSHRPQIVEEQIRTDIEWGFHGDD